MLEMKIYTVTLLTQNEEYEPYLMFTKLFKSLDECHLFINEVVNEKGLDRLSKEIEFEIEQIITYSNPFEFYEFAITEHQL